LTVFHLDQNVVQNTLIIDHDRVWCQGPGSRLADADTVALRRWPIWLIMI